MIDKYVINFCCLKNDVLKMAQPKNEFETYEPLCNPLKNRIQSTWSRDFDERSFEFFRMSWPRNHSKPLFAGEFPF